ncbi:hypothetical protein D187_006732 [Cystobacter fuscus DSM 2262]|uniref:Uncharacterized protein n=1 Tax=Cystobacter fuscus (strain ATCC 25194 / DSM 2262 / NBRC 100088 / M29) TaxID=1242864 RepID=S9QKH0_CYSF2|nr:hypothetical protein D187_006732 [Cystobacter fuscus DSM 2262]
MGSSRHGPRFTPAPRGRLNRAGAGGAAAPDARSSFSHASADVHRNGKREPMSH